MNFSPHTRNSKLFVNGILSSTLTLGWKPELVEILDNILIQYDIFEPLLANEILSEFRVELNKYLANPESILEILPNTIKIVLNKFGYPSDSKFIETLLKL